MILSDPTVINLYACIQYIDFQGDAGVGNVKMHFRTTSTLGSNNIFLLALN